jgi:hypothetical protein
MLFFGAMLAGGCVTDRNERLLRDFPALRPTAPGKSEMQWTKYDGDDFLVFYGELPGEGGAGIYQGGSPEFKIPRGEKPAKGKLGVFDVDWYEIPNKGSKFYRSCLIDYQKTNLKRGQRTVTYTTKRHIWAYSDTEAGLKAVIAELDKLTMFAARPADITE